MTDYGAQDTSTTVLGANQFPISEVWTPNAGFSATEGGAQTTDSGSKKSAPVRVEVKDGSNITAGSKADARDAHTDATAISMMQVLKQISFMLQNPATTPVSGTFWQATQPVSLAAAVATNADTTIGGTTAPAKELLMAGKTNDATAQYQPLPEGAGGRSVIIEGYAGGTAVPVSGTFWQATQPTSVADGSSVTMGAKADARDAHTDATAISMMSVLKEISFMLQNPASVAVTESGTWTVQPGNTANTTPWLVQDAVESSGGSIPYHNLTAATTNFTNVKASAAQCYGLNVGNTSASAIYVKLYDKASAPATTDTPKHTFYVPANALMERAFPKGLKFTTGFGWAATGAVADNDNTAIAANCVVDFDLNS